MRGKLRFTLMPLSPISVSGLKSRTGVQSHRAILLESRAQMQQQRRRDGIVVVRPHRVVTVEVGDHVGDLIRDTLREYPEIRRRELIGRPRAGPIERNAALRHAKRLINFTDGISVVRRLRKPLLKFSALAREALGPCGQRNEFALDRSAATESIAITGITFPSEGIARQDGVSGLTQSRST